VADHAVPEPFECRKQGAVIVRVEHGPTGAVERVDLDAAIG